MRDVNIGYLRASFLMKRIEAIPHDRFVLHGALHFHKLLRSAKPTLKNRRLRKFACRGVYATRYIEVAALYALSLREPTWLMEKNGKIKIKIPAGGEYAVAQYGFLHVLPSESFSRGLRIVKSERGVSNRYCVKIDYHFLEFLIKRGVISFVQL